MTCCCIFAEHGSRLDQAVVVAAVRAERAVGTTDKQ
jgi:hypothetical protein